MSLSYVYFLPYPPALYFGAAAGRLLCYVLDGEMRLEEALHWYRQFGDLSGLAGGRSSKAGALILLLFG